MPGVGLDRCLCFAAACLFLITGSATADQPPPKVLGDERIHAADSADAVAAGQLLLGELNCTSCHAAAAPVAEMIQRKPAPVLDSVGSRVRPRYLLKFLADPQATKPGTTMPNVLAALPAAQRQPIAEALVHFLATTGELNHANPMQRSAERGERLFHAVGCVACHDPRTSLPGGAPAEPVAASISLGTPSQKYTLPGLTQFLVNPLAVRPGGRMPQLGLSPAEARDIASFLLNDLDLVSGLQYAYYEGDWQKLPKFDKLTPVAAGDAADFDLSMARRRNKFALRFEGTIELPQDGDYLFLIGTDDGARLLIDDKPIVISDGVHPFEQRRKKVKMKAGLHAVVVEYFQHEGESALQLDFEAPGQTQQPLSTLLAAPSIQKGTAPAAEAFAIDPAKAAQGREYFATLGCAACHTLNVGGSPLAPAKMARSLSELGTSGGCLDSGPGKAPWYALSERQAAALRAAIQAAKHPAASLTAEQTVERALVRFNCIACHQRKHVGGVVEARNAFFQSDMPEMGDEGRLPPSLTGAGAKLTAVWLRTVLEEGAKDRPYMLTRMPKFGAANVRGLAAAFTAADATDSRPAPDIHIASDELKRYKAAGRRLVGAQGFSCIKCHTFAGQRSSGIQALSLTTMTRRLRREWFYHYLQNPLVYRPGTRMPTAFPDGQTTLPAVLDGTVSGQIAAIWTYLADGDKAQYPVGLVTGKIELVAFDEAVIYRNFIDGAGTRAIGVGYPEKLNLAFDASDMRLALLWQGGFIDAARHWTARGQGFEKPLGDKVLRLPEGPAIAALADSHTPWPGEAAKELGLRFGGYRLDEKQRPTFLYSWHDASHPSASQRSSNDSVQIEDKPQPVGEQDLFAMHRTITATGSVPAGGLWLRAVQAGQIEDLGKSTYRIDNQWTLLITADRKPLLRQQGGEWELLIPLVFDGPQSKQAKIELTYDW